jgi:hypothetical protein
MENEQPFTHPIQYLQARLHAFTTASTTISQLPSAIDVPAPPNEEPHSTADQGQEERPTNASSTQVSLYGESKKAARRAMTSYQLAQPPPTGKSKFKLRRVVLQLRQISVSRSPAPAMEALPITPMGLPSILAKLLPQRLTPRSGPYFEDLALFKCQPYNTLISKDDISDDDWSQREIAAAIYQIDVDEPGAPKKAEICLSEGSTWMATSIASGGYEFLSTDRHGIQTKARWVPRHAKSHRQKDVGTQGDDPEKRKFKFSLLNHNSRRHPVIGYIDRQTIDVFDHFVIPADFTHSSGPATSSLPSSVDESASKHMIGTDDRLRGLILITGTWVAYAEGWIEAFKHPGIEADKEDRATTPQSPMPRHSSFRLRHRETSSNPIVSKSPGPERTQSLAGGSFRAMNSNRAVDGSSKPLPTTKRRPFLGRRATTGSNIFSRTKVAEPPISPLPAEPAALEDDEDEEEASEHIGDIPRLPHVGLGVHNAGHDDNVSMQNSLPSDSASTSIRTDSLSTPRRPGKVNKMLNFLNKRVSKEH